mgnify:CR=1 FL=1
MREMKDSGIEWIGQIPKDWDVVPHKRVMHKVKEICAQYNGEDIISLTMNGVIKRDLAAGGKMPTSFDGYQYVKPNDLLLCLFDIDVTPRCVGVVKDYGVTSPAYSRFIMHDGYYNAYYDYLLRAIDDDKVFVHLSKNLRSSLTESDFGAIKTCVPSLAEQERIAAFLDAECAEIDAVLEKTRASIEEYKKLKQAVITQAVTKGIRGDRPMKDSGIEWIGEIPAGVPISRVGLHFDIVLGKMLCSAPVDDNYTSESYYCAADVHFEGLSNGEKKKMWFSPDEKEQYCVKNGDLLVVEGGAGAGGCAIAVSTDVPIYIQNSIMIVRSKGISNIRYLRYLLECLVKEGYIDVVCNKATIPHFTKDKLANVPFIVFSQSEQEEIAEYLNEKCAGIDALIVKKQQYLTEIENYKKSLIYEYVTGKKEVV